MNIAQNLGLFLSLFASIEGTGSEVAYPGDEASWRALHTDSSQDLVAHFTIFVSLRPAATVAEKAFNIAHGAVSWEQVWPGICSYFGLKGVGPGKAAQKLTGAEWVFAHRDQWAHWVETNGLKKGVLENNNWDFIDFLMTQVRTDRHFELSAAPALGFHEGTDNAVRDNIRGYEIAFDRMRVMKLIPMFLL
jgi:hypothetical protein